MNRASGHRVLTWRRLVVGAAVGLVVLSLGQAVLRGDREALLLVVAIVVAWCCWVEGGGR